MTNEMQALVAKSIATLRVAMIGATDEERLMIIEQITAGYCTECGTGDTGCQCWNDE